MPSGETYRRGFRAVGVVFVPVSVGIVGTLLGAGATLIKLLGGCDQGAPEPLQSGRRDGVAVTMTPTVVRDL